MAPHRFHRTLIAALTALAGLALAGGALPLAAQTVAGRVLDAESGGGLAGAFVVLADSAGHRIAMLADEQGRFVLSGRGPGRYTLRAERIGMGTQTLGPFRLAAGERRTVVLSLVAEAVPLAAIEVAARRRCELRPGSGEATARIWENVRKALRISSWSRSVGEVEYVLRRHERMLDLPSRMVRYDSVREFSGAAARPFTSEPPEQLARLGYVRQDDAGSYIYFGPDEEVLASESFLDGHCLQLRQSGRDNPGMLAIEFRPVRRGGPVDIEGTAWVDERSGELRSIEFRYYGLSVPAQEAGGRIEYRKLPGGAWIIDRWRLAFPMLRRNQPYGLKNLSGAAEIVAFALHETTGEVVSLRVRGSGEVRTDAGRTGSLSGMVYDSARGQPIARARVYLSGTVHGDTADAAGRFRIRGVPPGVYSVAFASPVLDSLVQLPAGVSVTIAAGRDTAVQLWVPGRAAQRRAACPSLPAGDRSVILFGDLSGGPDERTSIRATWQRPGAAGTSETADVKPDEGGRYVLCGLPAATEISVRAVRRGYAGSPALGAVRTALVPPGGIRRLDVPSAGI